MEDRLEARIKRAFALREQRFNCAQAVIGPVAADLGVPEETAMGFAGGLGGGLRAGEVCGAACGAALALGLKYGQTQPFDEAAKAHCGEITGKFMEEFRRRTGALRCLDLLGCDPHSPESAEKKLTVCPVAIRTALEILEEVGI